MADYGKTYGKRPMKYFWSRFITLLVIILTLFTIYSSSVYGFGSGAGGALPSKNSSNNQPTNPPSPATINSNALANPTNNTKQLQCGNKPTLHDRIVCRLSLTPAQLLQEYAIQYLPEECRAMTDQTYQKACVNRYLSYRSCWNIPEGDARFTCARKALQLGDSIPQLVSSCNQSTNPTACMQDLRTKVYGLIIFRMYNLEERAETLLNKGVSVATVADFETTVETKKQAFDNAATTQERKQIILDVRQAWQDFLVKVANQIQ